MCRSSYFCTSWQIQLKFDYVCFSFNLYATTPSIMAITEVFSFNYTHRGRNHVAATKRVNSLLLKCLLIRLVKMNAYFVCKVNLTVWGNCNGKMAFFYSSWFKKKSKGLCALYITQDGRFHSYHVWIYDTHMFWVSINTKAIKWWIIMLFYFFNINFVLIYPLIYLQLQRQLYTAKSQCWLHKAGASPEHWQLKKDNFTYEMFNENIK